MIDNPATVARLIEQMRGHLPIPAFPSKGTVRTLRRGGLKVSVDRVLAIKHVFYAGDDGGIMCDVTPGRDAKQVIIALADPPANCSASCTLRSHPGLPT